MSPGTSRLTAQTSFGSYFRRRTGEGMERTIRVHSREYKCLPWSRRQVSTPISLLGRPSRELSALRLRHRNHMLPKRECAVLDHIVKVIHFGASRARNRSQCTAKQSSCISASVSTTRSLFAFFVGGNMSINYTYSEDV